MGPYHLSLIKEAESEPLEAKLREKQKALASALHRRRLRTQGTKVKTPARGPGQSPHRQVQSQRHPNRHRPGRIPEIPQAKVPPTPTVPRLLQTPGQQTPALGAHRKDPHHDLLSRCMGLGRPVAQTRPPARARHRPARKAHPPLRAGPRRPGRLAPPSVRPYQAIGPATDLHLQAAQGHLRLKKLQHRDRMPFSPSDLPPPQPRATILSLPENRPFQGPPGQQARQGPPQLLNTRRVG